MGEKLKIIFKNTNLFVFGSKKEKVSAKRAESKSDFNLQIRNIIIFLAYLISCACCFYLIEFFVHNPFVEVRTIPQILNIILFELLGLAILFIVGSIKFALRIMLSCSLVFGLINYYVLKFRSTPFVPWDLWSIKTAKNVASNYNYALSTNAIIVIICFFVFFLLSHFLDFKVKNIKIRLLAAVMTVLGVFMLAQMVQNDDNSYKLDLYPFLFTPDYMNRVNGATITFTMNLKYLKIDKPSDYSKQNVKNILKEYQKNKTDNEFKKIKFENKDKKRIKDYPNIIVVMDEAFSDLEILGDIHTNEELLPNLKKLQESASYNIKNAAGNNIKIQTGYLNVSVCGGNTANTEFEFLTGNTMAFLPSGSIPYQQYIKKDLQALPRQLRNLGYKCYALHPYFKDGWERQKVYPMLGFEKFYSLENYENPEYIRDYISDRTVVNKIIELYEKKDKNDRLFLFNVTMQNHGSYYEEFKNFTPSVKVVGSSNFSLKQYLSLINKTDKDLDTLIRYFKNKSEKTIIVFFGDHQPSDSVVNTIFELNGKDTSKLDLQTIKNRYKVPYVIWANYDIKVQNNKELSVNYLATDVLKMANIPTSPYQNFLFDLQKKHSVITSIDKPKDDKMLKKYKNIQYYNLFDN